MSGHATAVYAGIVVSDVAASAQWYEQTLPCTLHERGEGWGCLIFPDASTIELFSGDPARAGDTFPSYAGAVGPPVMPGYAAEDPEELVAGLTVTRSLPDWYVVVAPDGLRVVVTVRDTETAAGLAGFRFVSPTPTEQRTFLSRLGITDEVVEGDAPAVVPLVVADRTTKLTDPDGTPIHLVAPVS